MLDEFTTVHELVHLFAPNHGRVFNRFLHAYLLDWREQRPQMSVSETAASNSSP